jgi:hypothetical protein
VFKGLKIPTCLSTQLLKQVGVFNIAYERVLSSAWFGCCDDTFLLCDVHGTTAVAIEKEHTLRMLEHRVSSGIYGPKR